MEKTGGALQGLRVIDFGQYVAGPAAAMILGDYGADVIHVDPPGGPVWDEWNGNAALMRGKRNISLDLKKEEDLAIAKKLVATADIVIENFRPGVMDRLGLGWEACHEANPALIYCSLPGFSASDEARRDIPGWEGIVSAEGGLYNNMDYYAGKSFFRFNALPLASLFAAVIGCHSIAAALIVREKTGLGQHIESSLFEACYEADSTRCSDSMYMIPPGMERDPAQIHSNTLLRMMVDYPCADGRYVQTTPPPRGAVSLARALFPKDWVENGPPPEAKDMVRELMLQRTMREWEDFAQHEHGAGVAVAQTSEEWLREPSAQDSRTAIHVTDPILGETIQPGVPSLMLRSGDSAGQHPRHLPDADREEILRELETLQPPAYTAKDVEPELPLKGIKVLDLCQVVAGPTCGRLLAEYGAEVLKINNPRIMDNFTALGGHETQGNGKVTIFLDLKSEQGKRVMEALIRESDVFHCNFAQSAYINLGYTEEELRARNPGIILSQVNIHSIGGGREWMRGHEDLGEAVTGMAVRYSGSMKPTTLPMLVLDHMTGQMSALGIVLAIYHRYRSGEGQRVQACLSRSSTVAQLPYMITFDGKVWNEPSGLDCLGFHLYDRIYQAKDTYFYMVAKQPQALHAIPALADLPWDGEGLEAALEARFMEKDVAEWLALFEGTGVVGRRCRNYLKELPEDPYGYARGIMKREEHPGMGMIRTAHCAPRMSLTPPQPGYPSSEPGRDTEWFLAEFEKTHPI